MFTRRKDRSGGGSGSGSGDTANGNSNGSAGVGLTSSSPSKPETKPKSKNNRGCFEKCRLCLLQSRGNGCCWLILFLITATYAAIQQFVETGGQQIYSAGGYLGGISSSTAYTTTNVVVEDPIDLSDYSADRILFRPLTANQLQKTSNYKKPSHKEKATFESKPIMMGMILEPGKDFMVNYNNKQRRHSKPLQKLRKPRDEKFNTIQIDYRNPLKQQHYINQDTHNHLKGKGNERRSIHGGRGDSLKTANLPKDIEWKGNAAFKVPLLFSQPPPQKTPSRESKDYFKGKPDHIPDGCVAQYDWQFHSFPNCNEIHQLDIPTKLGTTSTLRYKKETEIVPESMLLARGGYREVWMVRNSNVPPTTHNPATGETGSETIAMKTLLYERDITERNIDRHRRDAVATDRLQKSKMALNIFGYCSNTALYEFANGGSLENVVEDKATYSKWSSRTKLQRAYEVAQAIADVHNIDHEGRPSMSHTDISMSQFVSTDGGKTYRINDFNRARFILQHKSAIGRTTDNSELLCEFEVASNKGKFRSPEEYAYVGETAAIDTYSMGNIFYVLLTGQYPFQKEDKKAAQKMVLKGNRPEIPKKYLESEDKAEIALVEAMKRCWIHKPTERATSREIEQYLKKFL